MSSEAHLLVDEREEPYEFNDMIDEIATHQAEIADEVELHNAYYEQQYSKFEKMPYDEVLDLYETYELNKDK